MGERRRTAGKTAPNYRRAPREARRQDLIDATARALARRGAGGVSVRAITLEAGVSPGLVSHYFDGIEALIVATYRDIAARVARTLDAAADAAGDDPRQRLSAYVAGSFASPVMDPALLATWLGFWSLTKSLPAMASAHAEQYGAFRAAIERLLADCGAPGDAGINAIALTALIDGLWLELCLDDSVFTPDQAHAIAEQWLDALLRPPSVANAAGTTGRR